MLVIVEKPQGYTSFDLVKKIKRLYAWEKIGHAWTLDPLATGVMLVAIGKDTKKIQQLVWLDKMYITTIDFSKKSDTRDSDYRKYFEEFPYSPQDVIMDGSLISAPSQQEIEKHLTSIIWTHILPLTPFSAKKRKGKKLYEYAREGNPVCIDIPMEVISYEILKYDFPFLELKIEVGSWTYIRSIAHRLGEQFHLWGILIALKRTSVGSYTLDI